MAIDINIPSQVKNYANLAGFPATGALKTIYIANDTNKTYRWTGSVYVEISGTDTSSLVPTSRTLTINGTTQDLSADRTFTISTGITIGTTAITSGTVGRVLFEGTGNVVSESANLFWDNTNVRLGIGGTPTKTFDITGSATSGFDVITFKGQYSKRGYLGNDNSRVYFSSGFDGTESYIYLSAANAILKSAEIQFQIGNTERMRINSNGNVLINTTTDAGFKLDVNGTARVVTSITTPLINGVVGTAYIRLNNSNGFEGGYNEGTGGAFQAGGSALTLNIGSTKMLFCNINGISIGKGETAPVASAQVEIVSTTKGFLPPRMTTTQKNAIASPVAGLMVYDTTLNLISVYNGTIWISL